MDVHPHLLDRDAPASSSPPAVPSLFREPWWLEAAAPGRIERVELRWDAVPVASLSFVSRTRFRAIRNLVMPPYTRTLGPDLNLPEAKPARHALNLQRAIRELRAMLPAHDRFHHILEAEDPTPIAFSLAGFSIGQTFTFRVPAGTDRDALLAGVAPDTRRLIRSGSQRLHVEDHGDIDRFLGLARRERPLERSIHDFGALERLAVACLARGRGTFLTVVDEAGRDLAAVFLVRDDRTAYYLVPVRDRAASGGGANAVLLWSALGHALDRGLGFDFDGFGSVGTARFMSSFGLPPILRHVVSYRSPRSRWIDLARRLAGSGEGSQDMYSHPSLDNARPSRRERQLRQGEDAAA